MQPNMFAFRVGKQARQRALEIGADKHIGLTVGPETEITRQLLVKKVKIKVRPRTGHEGPVGE